MSAPISPCGPVGNHIVKSKSRDCFSFDCLKRSDPISISEVEMPPKYSSLFVDVNSECTPVLKDMAKDIKGFFSIPLADSPLRPSAPMPKKDPMYSRPMPLFQKRRTSVLRRSPSFHPEQNSLTSFVRSNISMVPENRIPIPPLTNPFNLPNLPARDYILDKIKQDENRVKIKMLDKLENEVIQAFYSKANQELSPKELYQQLFYSVMEVFSNNYSSIKGS